MTIVQIELSASETARLVKFVAFRGDDDCWVWQGTRDKEGYGIFRAAPGRAYRATRAFWFHRHGVQPRGILCHKCDNPSCVNPAHLWDGTSAENTRDMIAKGRHPLLGSAACFRGHKFDAENTYLYRGKRACRACRSMAGRKRRAA